jgi:hypothetical protein
MSQKRRDELIAMMEQLEEDPIKPGDARYFDFYGVRGKPRGADPAENLRTTISLKARRMSCQLFSGFRGTGKTTELERLRAELEGQGFVVLFVKGAEVLHLHQPLNITDLLVSTAVGVAGEVERLIGQDPTTRSLVTKIVDFFKGTEVTSAELSAGIGAKVNHAPIEGQINLAQIKLQLSRSPAFKARIQGALRGRLPELLQQFGQFMRDVKTMLTPKLGGRSPVLILDDLEKIRGTGPDSDIVQASMEEIFSQQDRALHIDGWHTVWTAPPYLQLMNSMMENLYDGSFVLPMVRLWERDEARSKDETGFSAIRQCLRKRGDINSLFFKEELFDALIWASSGHLRDLLGLIRDAVREAYKQSDPTVPLNEMQVHSIVDDYEAGCRNAVYDEDLPWLEKVSQTRALRIPDPKMLMRVAKLLDTAVIMTYRNGETWVDVSRPVQRLLAGTRTESA